MGNFHKTLKHNEFGEVIPTDFAAFQNAAAKRRTPPPSPAANKDTFTTVRRGVEPGPMIPPEGVSASLVNPLAGLADDPLLPPPHTFSMPAPPPVDSLGIAAEMTELYWMALLRDLPFDKFEPTEPVLAAAAAELQQVYSNLDAPPTPTLDRTMDLPAGPITTDNIFRMGLPGEETGPLVSQFFIRDVGFGTQTIDQKQAPYRRKLNFLTTFPEWLNAQILGRGDDGAAYPQSNERHPDLYMEGPPRYISCMRDLARFVHKDALHQAYFNAALLLLTGKARWTPRNPYFDDNRRDSGFGTLGAPHILALVSEVATRALQTVWFQKWQTHLRLRPEAYGGRLHVQQVGVVVPPAKTPTLKPYGLMAPGQDAHGRIMELNRGSPLLPMAFTSGAPIHPAYGAGHATVAGACVTVLKAFFRLLDQSDQPLPIESLDNFPTYITGIAPTDEGTREPIPPAGMTIEGELNKLASNVAMGRSMGGVHWRTDNTRSLVLGEAVAAHMLSRIANDVIEQPTFRFRTFGRDAATGQPRMIVIGPRAAGHTGADEISIDGAPYALTKTINGKPASLSSLLRPEGFEPMTVAKGGGRA